MRRRLAFWIYPDLREEVAALQSGNTNAVLENGRLLDRLAEADKRIGELFDNRFNLTQKLEAAEASTPVSPC